MDAIDLLIVLSWTFVGAVLGRWLAVVADRWPRRENVWFGGSRCDACSAPIAWRDRLPIYSYIRLRGRARCCGAALSGAHLWFEAGLALAAGLVAWSDLVQRGAGLFPIDHAPDVLSSEQGPYLLAGFHLTLLSGLAVLARLEQAGRRLPQRLVALVLIVGLVVPLEAPDFIPYLAFEQLRERAGAQTWLLGLMNVGFGVALGLVFGLLASPATGEGRSGSRGRASSTIALIWTGMFLGWQATAGIAPLAAIVWAIVIMYRPALVVLRHVPFAALVFSAVLMWIAWGSMIAAEWPHLGSGANHETIAASGAIVFVAGLIGYVFRGRVDLYPDLRAPSDDA